MTREELEATLQLAKSAKAPGKDTPGSVALALAHAPLCEAIVQLAEERDALSEAHAAALSDCDRLRDNLAEKSAEARSYEGLWKATRHERDVLLDDQRDRALALLRSYDEADGDPWWRAAVRALLAEVDG